MMATRRHLRIGLLIFLTVSSLRAQTAQPEAGQPFLRNYSYREYGAHAQNWAVAQDERGIVYVGNSDGVLEYDGARWRLIALPNNSIVRSLGVADDGTVFVGGVDEMGYLERDVNGTASYVSLLPLLSPETAPSVEIEPLGDVWRTLIAGDDVFFWSVDRLHHYRGGEIESRDLPSHRVPFLVRDELTNNHPKYGLMAFDGQEFQRLPGGERFVGVPLAFILPLQKDEDPGENGMLVGTQVGEIFVFDPSQGTSRRFRTEADEHLVRHRLDTAIHLDHGSFVVSTMTGGAVILGPSGEVLDRFDKPRGLADNSVRGLLRDREGGLWMALNRGLARADLGAPISKFGMDTGLDGNVEAIVRHRGVIYVGTSLGLYRLGGATFSRVPGVGAPCWSLLSVGDDLLAGAHGGVFAVDDEGARLVHRATDAFAVTMLPSEENISDENILGPMVAVGRPDGLALLERNQAEDTWIDHGHLPGARADLRHILPISERVLWLGTRSQGVGRVAIELRPEPRILAYAEYGRLHGLPDDRGIKVYRLTNDGEPLFGTAEGLYRYDSDNGRFEPSELLGRGRRGIQSLVVSPEGHVWTAAPRQGPAVAFPRGDGYEVVTQPFSRLPASDFYAILPERKTTWLGGTDGLFLVDLDRAPILVSPFNALLRRAETSSGPLSADSRLSFENNSVRFYFAAPSFSDESATRYRWFLQGYDAEASDWNMDVKKEYTNLPPGDYVFRVRAKNVYGLESAPASLAFSVAPPWYRSLAAYTVYAIFLMTLVTAITRFRLVNYEEEKEALALRETALRKEIAMRQLMQDALRDSEEKLKLALAGGNMGTWTWAVETNELHFSDQALRLLGLGTTHPSGGFVSGFRSVVHPQDRPILDSAIASTVKSGDVFEVEFRIVRTSRENVESGPLVPPGEIRWMHCRASVHRDIEERAHTITGTLGDITERKELDNERAARLRQLEERNAALEELSRAVTSDLKSPLVTIRGFLGLVRQDLESGDHNQLEKDLSQIGDAAGNMETLLEDLTTEAFTRSR